MGQYYKFIATDKDNNSFISNAWDYGSGAKLMEHSWIGNRFVNACLTKIYKNPCKLAWLGDYSNDLREEDGFDFDLIANIKCNYDKVWKSEEAEMPVIDDSELVSFNKENCNYYLINHTTKEFIDFNFYVDNNTIDGWCINPLPLLTAVGNGLGGGDFTGSEGKYDVGTWAFNEIEFTDEKPDLETYIEAEYFFSEDWF